MGNPTIPQNNANWLTSSTAGTQIPTSATTPSTAAAGPVATESALQFSQAGAQTGIDLALTQGPSFDIDAWAADVRGSMTADQQHSPDQINAFIATATQAFQSAQTIEQNGGTGATAGPSGTTPSGLSYQTLTTTVASQVLPLGVEPMPLHTVNDPTDDLTYAQGGNTQGASLPAQSNLAQIKAKNTQFITGAGGVGGGGTLHQAAVFNQAMEQTYNQTQAKAAATASTQNASLSSTPSPAPPPVLKNASPEVTAWYNGTGPSNFTPTFGDWTKVFQSLSAPDLSADDKSKIIAQINQAHPDWGSKLTAALAQGTGSDQDKATNSYPPFLAAAPGAAAGDAQSQALVSCFASADTASHPSKETFVAAAMELLNIKKTRPQDFDSAMNLVANGSMKLALQNTINKFSGQDGGNKGKDYDQSDLTKRNDAASFFRRDFGNFYDAKKKDFINNGAGTVNQNPYGGLLS